jgi:hypothetical protein
MMRFGNYPFVGGTRPPHASPVGRGPHRRRVTIILRDTRIRRQVFPLKEFIPLELYQDVVPQVRMVDPVGGKRFLGATLQGCQCLYRQGSAEFGQPSSSLLLLALLVKLFVDSGSTASR